MSTGADTGKIAILDRNDPFANQPRVRGRRAGIPDYDGLSGIETLKKTNAALALGATTIYLAPIKRRARSARGLILIHNPTAAGITIDLHKVPSGGAAAATNKLFPTKTVAVDETWVALAGDLWMVFDAGEALVANTGTAGLNAWSTFLEEKQTAHASYGGFFSDPDGTDRTILTVPGEKTFYLEAIHAYNRDAAGRTLTVNMRQVGAAAADGNELVAVLIATATEYNLDAKFMPGIDGGGVVSARGSGAGLAVWASGTLL